MEVGIIGLGKMGENMGVRLLRHGHTVYGADLSVDSRTLAQEQGIEATDSVANLAAKFTQSPRVFWLMVPAGKVTASVVQEVKALAKPGDVVVDGGNSNYKESIRHAQDLTEVGVHFLDCGTSGGVWGLENGYCLMVGGTPEAFAAVEPLFTALAPENGYAHVGPVGAGHFVKMIHNGIEYGLLEAYAEGFEMLHAAKEFDLDLHQVTALWNRGSVVRSWILELAERMYEHDQDFLDLEDDVADNGTGRWTVQESLDRAVPLPVISLALQMRFRSRQDQSYALRAIAALRNQFGGHAVVSKK
jgi:6-phosphogluconate dehydrogenase